MWKRIAYTTCLFMAPVLLAQSEAAARPLAAQAFRDTQRPAQQDWENLRFLKPMRKIRVTRTGMEPVASRLVGVSGDSVLSEPGKTRSRSRAPKSPPSPLHPV